MAVVITERTDNPKLRRVQLTFEEPSLAKQAFKAECDINTIVKRHQRKGIVTHLNPDEPGYGFAPSLDLKQAMDTVIDAQRAFDALPSEIRRRFSNDAVEFVEFAENPENREELRKLGLLEEKAVAEPVEPPVEPGEPNPPE